MNTNIKLEIYMYKRELKINKKYIIKLIMIFKKIKKAINLKIHPPVECYTVKNQKINKKYKDTR